MDEDLKCLGEHWYLSANRAVATSESSAGRAALKNEDIAECPAWLQAGSDFPIRSHLKHPLPCFSTSSGWSGTRKKGSSLRQRQPKSAAFLLQKDTGNLPMKPVPAVSSDVTVCGKWPVYCLKRELPLCRHWLSPAPSPPGRAISILHKASVSCTGHGRPGSFSPGFCGHLLEGTLEGEKKNRLVGPSWVTMWLRLSTSIAGASEFDPWVKTKSTCSTAWPIMIIIIMKKEK